MYRLLWISHCNLSIGITHCNSNLICSSFHNVPLHNVCRCTIMDCAAPDEHKELDYGSSSGVFDVLVMRRIFTFHQRKKHNFNSSNSFLLLHRIRLFMGHSDFIKVGFKLLWIHKIYSYSKYNCSRRKKRVF